MVAKRDNVVGQRVQAPAHGHNPLEIMTQQDYTQHPVTPPPELVAQWFLGAKAMPVDQWVTDVATQAAQYGADQELEACCEALYSRYVNTGLLPATAATVSQEMRDWLRTTRRPKPPSLKEQALNALKVLPTPAGQVTLDITDLNTIRRALEQLSDTQ